MNMKHLFAIALAGACFLTATASQASAARTDAYRDMLAHHSCTVKYENITPAERIHNREIVDMTATIGRMTSPELYANQPYQGVLVLNGSDKYVEIRYPEYVRCELTKGDDVYRYQGDIKKGSVKYRSDAGKRKVKAQPLDRESQLLYGENFGPSDVSQLFTVMLKPEQKPAGTAYYYYAGSGMLDGGLAYEDYRADYDNGLAAVRYYFQGNQLVKIASATYRYRADGSLDGQKCILKIDEFSSTPEASYLNLPEGMKVVKDKK
ncbi:hypothetical protein [uncultured Selenomonas sp.]|uniref:hypothetical protein n=1 Tax=uncultured Selenomonas sp. TaxID=159275 RepID=UPI0025F52E68|nr:hypothetical protein [uncultured Selenomonas sp.]